MMAKVPTRRQGKAITGSTTGVESISALVICRRVDGGTRVESRLRERAALVTGHPDSVVPGASLGGAWPRRAPEEQKACQFSLAPVAVLRNDRSCVSPIAH